MKLVLGTVQFGLRYGISNNDDQSVPMNEVRKILSACRMLNINTLDTAISYGDSETKLGAAGVQSFNIITKIPSFPKNEEDIERWIRGQLESSLERLKVKSLYGVMHHSTSQLQSDESLKKKTFLILESLKKESLVEKIGISIYTPDEIKRLNNLDFFDIVQAPFNYFDRRLLTSGWMSRLSDAGKEIHVRSIFLQGLMLMPADRLPMKFLKWRHVFLNWHEWLKQNSMTPIEGCIGFIKCFTSINSCVIGVLNADELKEINNAFIRKYTIAYPKIEIHDERLVDPSCWDKI